MISDEHQDEQRPCHAAAPWSKAVLGGPWKDPRRLAHELPAEWDLCAGPDGAAGRQSFETCWRRSVEYRLTCATEGLHVHSGPASACRSCPAAAPQPPEFAYLIMRTESVKRDIAYTGTESSVGGNGQER